MTLITQYGENSTITNILMAHKVTAIIQARTNSSSLPGKVLADLAGRSMLAFQLERLQRCQLIDEILLATTDQTFDDALAALSKELNIVVVRGREHDVLSRFALAAESTTAKTLLRITGDCPLIDSQLLSYAIV